MVKEEIYLKLDLSTVPSVLQAIFNVLVMPASADNISSRYDKHEELMLRWDLVNRKTRETKYTIVFGDTIELNKENYGELYNRLFKYLDLNKYQINQDNALLMLLLHEIGHIIYTDRTMQYNFYKENVYIKDMTEKLVHLNIPYRRYKNIRNKGHIDLFYQLSAEEQFCDSFAIMHFAHVYNLLNIE